MHAVDGTVGHPSTDDSVTLEVTLTLRIPKAPFHQNSPFEDIATALGTDLHNILEEDFVSELRSANITAETSVRSRLL